MKRIIASLAILLILMGGAALAAQFEMVAPSTADNSRVQTGLDSSQPDTIQYDNGAGQYYLSGAINYWGKVRFTCPADFELRSIYVQGLNPSGNQAGCDVYVRSDNAGNPGGVIGGPYHINGPFTSYVFSDAEVPSPYLQFTEGQSFHIVFGPAPGGSTGWFLYLDGGPGTRSAYGPSQNGPWTATSYNLMLRAGGVLESYTDIAAISTFTNPALWFMEEGSTMDVKAEVENVGTDDIASYTINWTARNSSGTTVWTETGNYTNLASGASIIQTASTQFAPSTPGYYELESNAIVTGDANPDNNIYLMELGVGDLGWDWMKFDDGSFESQIQFQNGGYGQRFDVQDHPAEVDSIKVGLGSNNPVTDIRIYHYDPIASTYTQLWQYTGAVTQGWNTFSFDPEEVVIFDGSIIVVYMYQTGCAMQKDDNTPIAAGNENMPTTAYQVTGTGFSPESSGDWAFRCFASPTEAIPPDPVIETSADTLRFGAVTIGDSLELGLWVKNVGGGDVLHVTNILFNPVPISPMYSASPIDFSVGQGDSVEVHVNFHPAAEQAYNGALGMMNNTAVSPYLVRVEGSGTTQSVHHPEPGTLPGEFSLTQNYPNPFNPSTEISFGLPVSSNVTLTIYNVLGQEVATIANQQFDAGYHTVVWDAGNMPSGIYFYRLSAGSFTDLKKMVLMK